MPRVLAVDDNVEFLETFRNFLEIAMPSAQTLTAASGEEALILAKKEDPDVVLLDIVMPDIDGFEVCQRLKADAVLRDIPVVFMTAMDTDPDYRVKALEIGAEGFHSKNLEQNELIAQINAMAKIKAANRRDRLEKEELEQLVKKASSALEKQLTEVKQLAGQWEKTFNTLSDALFILDKNMRVVRVNSAASRMFELDNHSIIGKYCYTFVHGTSEPVEGCPLQKAKTSQRRETEDLMIGERWFNVVVEPILDKEEQLEGFVHIISDITSRKEMELKLKEEDSLLTEAEQLARLGRWHWDVRTGEVSWSDQVYNIYQLDPDTFTPQIDRILALSPWKEDHERNEQLIRIATESHEPGTYEQRFLRPDKSTGWYFSTFKGVYDDSDTLVAIRGTVQDITERKRHELEVELQSKRNAVLLELPKAAERWNEEVFLQYAREFIEDLTGSSIASIEIIGEEGIHKGFRKGIWAETLRTMEPVTYNDFAHTPGRQSLLKGQVNLVRLITVPVIENDNVVMLAAAGNKGSDYTADNIESVQLIANEVWRLVHHRRALRIQKEAEAKFRLMATSSVDCIFWTDPDRRYRYVSPACKTITGYSPADLVEDSGLMHRMIHPDDRQLFDQHLSAHSETTCSDLVFRIIRKDGEIRWIEHQCKPLYDEQGHYLGRHGTNRDITRRRNAEALLVQQETRFREIAETIQEVFHISDPLKRRFLYASPAFEQLWGRSIEDLMQSPQEWLDAIHPEDQKSVKEQMFSKKMRKEFEQEFRIIRPDNEIRWIRNTVFPVLDKTDKVERLIGVAEDITERKRYEDQFKLAKSAVDAFEDATVWTNLDGRIIYANDAAVDSLGYSQDELLAFHIWDIDAEMSPDKWPAFSKEVVSQQKLSIERRHQRKNGETYWAEVKICSVESHQGTILCGAARDLSERLEAERQLRQHAIEMENRNTELEQFNQFMVDRELRMIELKKEINQLCKANGLESPYSDIQLPE